jgi:hypothetical protein
MKNVRIIPIPKGVIGYLCVLPNVKIWTFDHFIWDWTPALYVFSRRPIPIIDVHQHALATSELLYKKDVINEAMILDGYYAFLTRSNGCFGVAYAEYNFIYPNQYFIK